MGSYLVVFLVGAKQLLSVNPGFCINNCIAYSSSSVVETKVRASKFFLGKWT